MRASSSVLAVAGLLSTANAAIQGFNYGASFNNNQAKLQADFEYEFEAAKQLPGTSGWTSARLYTMIQYGTTNTVIEAIQAAIDTQTTLLLGMWASAGQASFNNEVAALTAAIQQYGTAFTDLVVGISVGSEDLYRITPTGIENNSGAGAEPSDLVNYIQQTRSAIAGTSLAGKPIGHVDTWTAYVNATNDPVIAAVDFLGVDAYPYYQTTMDNSIGSASQLFFDAYNATVGAAQGKPVWVTETGWPVSGATLNQAVPSPANAQIYWDDVTCQLISDNVNLYYYTLQDVQYGNPSPSFGIKPAGDLMSVQPLFDLSCPASAKPSSAVVSHTARVTSRTTGMTSRTVKITSRAASSSIRVPTSTGTSTQLSSLPRTTRPTTRTIPMITHDSSKPTIIHSSSASSVHEPSLEDLLTSIATGNLPEPFEASYLIIPIDKANPTEVIGNSYTAQLSPTVSTVFVYDVSPAHEGKICTLAFYLPPPFDYPDMAPITIRAPGGISVSRVSNEVLSDVNANDVGSSGPVGSVASVQSGHQYNIANAPCEAGQTVGYQVESLDGLDMNWFQMTNPPLGLFMLVN